MFKCQTVSFLEESESERSLPRRRAARKVLSWGRLLKPQRTVNSTEARQNFRAFSRLPRNPSSHRPCSPTVGYLEGKNGALSPVIYPWPLLLKLKLDSSSSRPRSKSLRKRRSQRQRVFWGVGKQCCPLRSITERGAAKTFGEEGGKRSRRWLQYKI